MGDHLGCGMDNLPRWPRSFTGEGEFDEVHTVDLHPSVREWYLAEVAGRIESKWNKQGRFIDLSAQMALDARILSKMAALLDFQDDQSEFQSEYTELAKAINESCWSKEHTFFFDLGFGKQIKRYHIGAYWCLIAGIVPVENEDAFCSHLCDSEKFDRPVPVPTLAADDPDYKVGGQYWLGSSWAPTNYMVLKGLQSIGKTELAKGIAGKYVQAVFELLQHSGTIWENMTPEKVEPGSWSGPDFCGWSGLGSVAIPREFLASKPNVRKLA